MIDIIQPTPRIIGCTIAQRNKPIIVARTIPITLEIFFNAVRAGEGVKLVIDLSLSQKEFLICLSFSVIRRYFFNAYNRSLKFVRSMKPQRAGSRGMFASRLKKYKDCRRTCSLRNDRRKSRSLQAKRRVDFLLPWGVIKRRVAWRLKSQPRPGVKNTD